VTLPPLPDDFVASVLALEEAYLASDDPIAGSGFSGGPLRWEAERRPILEAIDGDGDLLDVGCANGYLLECLVDWAASGGRRLVPHGLDIGERLIAAARRRLPEFASNLHVGNAWDWVPPRRYRFVYTLWDIVPEPLLPTLLGRIADGFVEPGGRLILGAYGSRTRSQHPFDVAGMLQAMGLDVAGSATAGEPITAAFAWAET
jgi:hypothetical protein